MLHDKKDSTQSNRRTLSLSQSCVENSGLIEARQEGMKGDPKIVFPNGGSP